MDITKDAAELIGKEMTNFDEPIIAIYEHVYNSWCGLRRVNSITSTSGTEIKDKSQFDVRNSEKVKVPIYIQKKISGIWDSHDIDVVGWKSFKRLALVKK